MLNHYVFSFSGRPAAWKESVVWVTDAFARQTTPEERRRLRRIGDEPVVARLWLASGERIDVAARARDRETVLGPFAGLEGTNGRGHEATVKQRIREER